MTSPGQRKELGPPNGKRELQILIRACSDFFLVSQMAQLFQTCVLCFASFNECMWRKTLERGKYVNRNWDQELQDWM